MEIYEPEPETNLLIKEEEEKEKTNPKFNFHILSLNRNDFEITLELQKESIIIYACSQEKNKINKNYYKQKFTIEYFRKYFEDNYPIDKYFYEIKSALTKSEQKCIINELKDNIEIIINMDFQKKKELSFTIKRQEKSVDEKIGELYNLINNLYKEKEEQKKEIDTLKEKLKNLENQEIHIIGKEGNEKGSLIEISTFDESKFKNFVDKEFEEDKIYSRILFKYEINKKDNLIKFIESYSEEFKKENLLISFKNNSIFIDIISNFNLKDVDFSHEKKSNIMKNLLNINDLFNININFKTDLSIKNIFDIKSSKEIFNIFFKLKIIITGLTLNFKLWLKSLLFIFFEKEELNKLDKENPFLKLYNLKEYLNL